MDWKDLGSLVRDELRHVELVARGRPFSWWSGGFFSKLEQRGGWVLCTNLPSSSG